VICLVCATEFTPPINNPQKIYCCRACNLAAWKKRNPEKHRQNVEADRPKAAARYEKAKAARPAPCPRPKLMAPCPLPPRVCGCGMATLGKWKVKCADCVDEARRTYRQAYKKTEPYKALRRAYKAKDKALRRARILQDFEAFDPIKVFMRDKWHCQLCGVSTPKRLRGTYEDDAPELDHVVPLALGGSHTWANVQCACRSCNISKGARALGQMGLELSGGALSHRN